MKWKTVFCSVSPLCFMQTQKTPKRVQSSLSPVIKLTRSAPKALRDAMSLDIGARGRGSWGLLYPVSGHQSVTSKKKGSARSELESKEPLCSQTWKSFLPSSVMSVCLALVCCVTCVVSTCFSYICIFSCPVS